MNLASPDKPLFDSYAADYDRALRRGIDISGESKEFFASGRVQWLSCCLREQNYNPQHVLDFGCGTGTATPFLLAIPGAKDLTSVDVSPSSLAEARRLYSSSQVQFQRTEEFSAFEHVDLAFCNGVFHHIPVLERDQAVCFVRKALRPGGLFAFWENNPWNPGTRYVMSRIPFDRNAVTLSAVQACRLLRANGFSIVRTDFLFLFPRFLSWLRNLEPAFVKLPFGAQYQVLARREP
jgi:SAM-dependent methyltransferase